MISVFGCTAARIEAARKKAEERERYIKEIEAQVESTPRETLLQAKVQAVIGGSLPDVYKAAIPVLTRLGKSSIVTPTPATLPDDLKRFWVIYRDSDPIYHKQEPITVDEDLPTADLDIYVTVLLEARGPNATTVYFYPHNQLSTKISEALQELVDANMIYRGRLFIYRLDTQTAIRRNWLWLAK